MRVLDLKFAWHLGHLPSMKEGRPYVYWQTRFFSGHGVRACPAFRQCVTRYHGNFKVKSFSCLDQYLVN